MRYFILMSVVVSLIAGPVAAAAESPTEERVGVGAGLLVGAAAGGPVGAIVGAAIGAKLGDGAHRRKEEVQSLAGSLAESEQQVVQLTAMLEERDSEISELDSELQRVQGSGGPELLRLLQAGIEMDLLFQTDQRQLAAGTQRRVGNLAKTVASIPGIRVEIGGYADPRGDATYNQQLSEDRAAHVRDLFANGGVSKDQLGWEAHGERNATGTRPDGFALDRRVNVRLSLARPNTVASAAGN